jgi:hypothetical protein
MALLVVPISTFAQLDPARRRLAECVASGLLTGTDDGQAKGFTGGTDG